MGFPTRQEDIGIIFSRETEVVKSAVLSMTALEDAALNIISGSGVFVFCFLNAANKSNVFAEYKNV